MGRSGGWGWGGGWGGAGWAGTPSLRNWEHRAWQDTAVPQEGGLGGSPELGLSAQTLSQAAPGI